jgi:DNA polymerase-1
MLIDGRNLAYRAIFGNVNNTNRRRHHFVVYANLLGRFIDKFDPQSVHIFWDSPKKLLWRKKLHPGYKDRDMSKYKVDITEDLRETEAVAKEALKYFGVRQYIKKKQEADDLIYSACRVMAPDNVIVISTDKDLHQIQYRMSHVKVYEPMKNKFVPDYDYDPVIQKALEGDKSDTIDGYMGIGPKKAEKMARDQQLLHEFLSVNDRSIFVRNMLLVDLNLNRSLLSNDFYVSKGMTKDIHLDKNKVVECAKKYKIVDIISSYTSMVIPYKRLMK